MNLFVQNWYPFQRLINTFLWDKTRTLDFISLTVDIINNLLSGHSWPSINHLKYIYKNDFPIKRGQRTSRAFLVMKSFSGRSTCLLSKGALTGTGGLRGSLFLHDLLAPFEHFGFPSPFFRKLSGELRGTFDGPMVLHGCAPARYSPSAWGL